MAVNRKLVAVVAADVVGYSRLMERDEAGTHERLRALNRDLIAPKVAEHGGRTVKTSGDGMLLEFPSATSALRCAVEVQRELGARNLYVAADEKIELRIGINLGDIIVEGDDILGDGVNVAARLETLAEPGGICVASAIWEQVHEDLGIDFVDAGEQHVKNISKPIHVYRVALGKGAAPGTALAAPTRTAPWSRLGGRRAAIAAAVLVAVTALGAVIGLWLSRQPPATLATAVDELPLRSVLIVPFEAAAGDPTLAETARRLTVDVTRALGDSMSDVRVAPATVAAEWAGKSGDARATGRGANVRFLIQGDLRPSGSQFAVTLRLVDTRDGRQIQTERRTIARDRPRRPRRSRAPAHVDHPGHADRRHLRRDDRCRAGPRWQVHGTWSIARLRLSRTAIRWSRRRSGGSSPTRRSSSIPISPLRGRCARSASLRILPVRLQRGPRSRPGRSRRGLAARRDARPARCARLGQCAAGCSAFAATRCGFRGERSLARARSHALLSGAVCAASVRAVRPARGGAEDRRDSCSAASARSSRSRYELACNAHIALGAYDAAIAACERAATATESLAALREPDGCLRDARRRRQGHAGEGAAAQSPALVHDRTLRSEALFDPTPRPRHWTRRI